MISDQWSRLLKNNQLSTSGRPRTDAEHRDDRVSGDDLSVVIFNFQLCNQQILLCQMNRIRIYFSQQCHLQVRRSRRLSSPWPWGLPCLPCWLCWWGEGSLTGQILPLQIDGSLVQFKLQQWPGYSHHAGVQQGSPTQHRYPYYDSRFAPSQKNSENLSLNTWALVAVKMFFFLLIAIFLETVTTFTLEQDKQ